MEIGTVARVWLLGVMVVMTLDSSAALSSAHIISESSAKQVLLASLSRAKRGLFNGEEQADRARETVRDGNTLVLNALTVRCRNLCWDEWSDWSSCSGPCNTGSRTRVRSTKTPPQECRSVPCIGGSSQSQPCAMDCGVGGNPAVNHCACLPGYQGTCCQTRITCPKPPNPRNGHVSGNEVWPAFYDSIAIYYCLPGFALIGPEQRRCRENGQWTGSNPKCEMIECAAPRPIENGKIINRKSSYHYNDVIGYECDIGHVLQGTSDRKCQSDDDGDGVWNIHAPTCQAVQCGPPGALRNGHRVGSDYSFNSHVTFSCRAGFTLIGSHRRTCLSTGTWSGRQPICKEVLCPMVENPPHGHISSRESLVNTVIVFSCDTGYRLEGDEYIACLPNGRWNGTRPACVALGCEHPGNPRNGATENNGLLLGNTVRFYCYSGYTMMGPKTSTCRADGTWSEGVPRCQECQRNFYKTGPANGGRCVRCPSNTRTLTTASTNRRQCVCNPGYTGNPGGPCTEIRCGPLVAPQNGSMVSCGNGFGERCVFRCDEGYILIHGGGVRTCLHTGEWDGGRTVCEACPRDTYKAGPSVCLPCPRHSRTPGGASSISQCACVDGYQGENGDQCTDIDECATGTHECQQGCTNRMGGYTCHCTIPSNKLNPDGRTCTPENQCRNLTEVDAPENGGLLCHHFKEQNSKTCSIKCNPGFEIATTRHNLYETCGPVTGYVWSHQIIYLQTLIVDESLLLPPCIESFFPEFQLEAESAYFVKACRQLNASDKFIAKRKFAETLTEQGICLQRATRVCDMRSVNIVCGAEHVVRKKRGIGYESVDAVNIRFKVFAEKQEIQARNCKSAICPMLRIPEAYCEKFCLPAYNRFLRGAVLNAKRQLTQLFTTGSRASLTFNVADRTFQPADDVISVSDVIVECEEGMVSHNSSMCVPCAPGTFYSREEKHCSPCPEGFHQPSSRQTRCLRCPVGSTTTKEGQANCTACSAGRYGDACARTCDVTCRHGDCDVVTGACVCHSGWEGDTCEQDIPGCLEATCHPGVTCHDVIAPGTGFTCGACPEGTTGDGMHCTPVS